MPLSVPKGTRVIEAAKYVNIDIPHLCYHPDQKVKAHCRMCAVEVEGSRKLLAACSTLVWEGMVIHTDTKKVRDTQVGILELILADHQQDCLNCARNKNCELQSLCDRFNLLNPSLTRVSKPPDDCGASRGSPVVPMGLLAVDAKAVAVAKTTGKSTKTEPRVPPVRLS